MVCGGLKRYKCVRSLTQLHQLIESNMRRRWCCSSTTTMRTSCSTATIMRYVCPQLQHKQYRRCYIIRSSGSRRVISRTSSSSQQLGTLQMYGPDRKGIVAATTNLLDRYGCTIVQSEQYTDCEENLFFQRIVFDHRRGWNVSQKAASISCQDTTTTTTSIRQQYNDTNDAEVELLNEFQKVTNEIGVVQGNIDYMNRPKRIGIMVSKYDHCLWEILLRHRANELCRSSMFQNCPIEIAVVLSNHDHCRSILETTFGIPYMVFPITAENKQQQEVEQIRLLRDVYQVDLIVLARYMQVLSPMFLQAFPSNSIMNIHHSFLPAFMGGRAYRQAYDRGVKLIGATAHYTTMELDEGPIIEQDVIAMTHRDTYRDVIRKGQSLERSVLVRAIQAHLENRIMVYNNKCIVFG